LFLKCWWIIWILHESHPTHELCHPGTTGCAPSNVFFLLKNWVKRKGTDWILSPIWTRVAPVTFRVFTHSCRLLFVASPVLCYSGWNRVNHSFFHHRFVFYCGAFAPLLCSSSHCFSGHTVMIWMFVCFGAIYVALLAIWLQNANRCVGVFWCFIHFFMLDCF